MRALLLAAGYGTRLRPLTDTIPKCLVPIQGRPLLDYWLQLLDEKVDRILINTHHLANQVHDYVSRSRWRDRVSLVYEASLLGTAGTILANRAFFGGEPFVVAHADNLTRFDVPAFITRHMTRPADVEITMMTFLTDVPESCGIIIEDELGIVREFHEKVSNPPGNIANGAVYIFEPDLFPYLKSLERYVIDLSTDVLPKYVGRICTFLNRDYHRDIGSRESLAKAELEFRNK